MGRAVAGHDPTGPSDAGAVHGDAQRPERGGQIDGGGDVTGVGHVGRRIGGRRTELLGQRFPFGRVAVQDDDVGPGADEPADGRLPEPGGPSGDDGRTSRDLHGPGD